MTTAAARLAQALERARSGSRYARRLLDAEPHLLAVEDIALPYERAAMAECLESAPAADAAAALRRLRKRVMLRLIARDLGGLADLEEVVATVSALAETALGYAAAEAERALAEAHGVPRGPDGRAQQLHVIGMGKLGGGELNVSSDVDLVFAYPEAGETDGARPLSNAEFFERVARRVIGLISELTSEGYVFRVDMRLRPWGADGALACDFNALEHYFVSHGREWERYAWIKARVLRGDRGEEIARIARPFVFRRHLDYSAFESLRELHLEVRAEVERRDIAGNIKLGPGGIREVEFIAQLFQLIRGGRDAALRDPSTLRILPRLSARRLLPDAAADALYAAYVFLRNLEHRLQYLDDRQTQTLPADPADLGLIAATLGCADGAALLKKLDAHRAHVTREFNNLFAGADAGEEELDGTWLVAAGDERHLEALRALGYGDSARAAARITALGASPRLREMPDSSRQRLRRLLPHVLAAAVRTPEPAAALERLLDLVESIGRREAYLTLLLQYPQVVEASARLAAASPWAVAYLTRHPILLDELLESHALETASEGPAGSHVPELRAQLRARLDDCGGEVERTLDVLREFKHAQTMRLIVQDLEGRISLETLSDRLSDLADALLAETLAAAWADLRTAHRAVPRFAIIGYGKLGGRELGYASDLDIIFLYDDEAPEAAENYARLAQRLNHWLTALTPAGLLYETDLRLRPDGASGLLVSSVAGYTEYQTGPAWTWEHQALTRARFVAGDEGVGARFEAIRADILGRPRDPAALRAEISAMRAKMREAHPAPEEDRFDIKHGRGGLVDVEFIVQYLVLSGAHDHAALLANLGNLALLGTAAELGLIAAESARQVQDAYRALRRLQHRAGLRGEKTAWVDAAQVETHTAAVRGLWAAIFGADPA